MCYLICVCSVIFLNWFSFPPRLVMAMGFLYQGCMQNILEEIFKCHLLKDMEQVLTFISRYDRPLLINILLP